MTPGSELALSGRRKFLGLAAAGAGGVLLAPGIHLIDVAPGIAGPPQGSLTPTGGGPGAARTWGRAQAATAGASPQVRWGLLIDTTKCASGCTDCITACNTENGLPGGTGPTDPQWIRKIEIKEIRTGRSASLPVMCQHCADPPCVDVCPTGASFKRADGIVLVDRHSCIGCRYCVMACPYKARSFVHEPVADPKPEVPRGKGCVEGCTMCVHRIDKGGSPACVEACSKAGHHAMLFGNLNDPDSEISQRVREVSSTQLRADLRLDPGVRYHGL